RRTARSSTSSSLRSAAAMAQDAPGAEIELRGVPAGAVPALWPRVEALVQRACVRSDGRYEADDVLRALQAREMQLWIALARPGLAIACVCVTEIVDYPRERRCGLVFCAGVQPERWLGCLGGIECWARQQGCAALELQGRPGWERLLGDWTKTHVVLRKRI